MLYILKFCNNSLADDILSVVVSEENLDIAIDLLEERGFILLSQTTLRSHLF